MRYNKSTQLECEDVITEKWTLHMYLRNHFPSKIETSRPHPGFLDVKLYENHYGYDGEVPSVKYIIAKFTYFLSFYSIKTDLGDLDFSFYSIIFFPLTVTLLIFFSLYT